MGSVADDFPFPLMLIDCVLSDFVMRNFTFSPKIPWMFLGWFVCCDVSLSAINHVGVTMKFAGYVLPTFLVRVESFTAISFGRVSTKKKEKIPFDGSTTSINIDYVILSVRLPSHREIFFVTRSESCIFRPFSFIALLPTTTRFP